MTRDERSTGEKRLGILVVRELRRRRDLEASRFAPDGRLRVPSFAEARRVAEELGPARAEHETRTGARAGELVALATLDAFYRHVCESIAEIDGIRSVSRALRELESELGADRVDAALEARIERFPPGDEQWRDREAELVDLVCLRLANANPAAEPYRELFDEETLDPSEDYRAVVDALFEWLARQAVGGAGEMNAAEMLESPAREVPDSLSGQLEWISRRFGSTLPEWLRRRLLTTVDVLREEERMFEGEAADPTLIEAPAVGAASDRARYASDRAWMPRLVLLAKNARVWLSQLSEKYDRNIERLDEIPEEELELLASRGITGLWLIGIWERSPASRRIKELAGRGEAAASAYAIDRYAVAEDLGGREAKRRLEQKADDCGLRLAADMVPNHMAIDSEWMIEHPDRFLSLDQPPFPSYSFDGPDLSEDDRVEIRIEDGYYDRSDAAVVFERRDSHTEETRYVYHGNDGTSTPWNDTAQIDFLNEEAREAVVEQILEVARAFPVIRFDAAMALAREQIRRLWHPSPGTGGAIPSRAEHARSTAEFDTEMPGEFWREVVDRVAEEAPDTLLLAEAFWKMEGYFVRTLGMHRVYNSAFMNMLREEANEQYRELMKKTLEFDPQILERYVNFLNNPDEETAVDQFGRGDKYFGVCTLMATLPGLPMFGHGQFEGYEEKYAMDFVEPRLDEEPDRELLERHRREIVPLLQRREMFARADTFRLYDFETGDGAVDENVFAYSNGTGDDRILVVYHNCYDDTAGRVRESVPYREVRDGETVDEPRRETLGTALRVPHEEGAYLTFRDLRTGREFLREAGEFAGQGLHLELGAYECRVFGDFQVVHDGPEGRWRRLRERLEGRGVESLTTEMRRMRLEPLHGALEAVLTGGWFREPGADGPSEEDGERLRGLRAAAVEVVEAAESVGEAIAPGYPEAVVELAEAARAAGRRADAAGDDVGRTFAACGGVIPAGPEDRAVFVGYLAFAPLVASDGTGSGAAVDRYDSLLLQTPFARFAGDLGAPDEAIGPCADAVRALLALEIDSAPAASPGAEARRLAARMIERRPLRRYLGIHEFDGRRWFDVDAMRRLVGALLRASAAYRMRTANEQPEALRELRRASGTAVRLHRAMEESGGDVDAFRNALPVAGLEADDASSA